MMESQKQSAAAAAVRLGFHTDAFNSAYFSFEKCLDWAQAQRSPLDRVRLDRRRELDPRPGLPAARGPLRGPDALRRKMDGYGVRFSQVDAAFPLSGREGPSAACPT